jgi:hypothetical protein
MSNNEKNNKGKKKGIEAKLVLDKPEAKVLEAKLDGKPIYWTVGTAKKSGKMSGAHTKILPPAIKARLDRGVEWQWKAYINYNNMPGWVPEDQIKYMTSSTMTTASGYIVDAKKLPLLSLFEASPVTITPNDILTTEGLKKPKEKKRQ